MTELNEDFKIRLVDLEDLSEETIENQPWAQRLLETCLQTTSKAVLNWCNIVNKIGDSKLDLDSYTAIFVQQITDKYEDLITDVSAIKEKMLDKVIKLQHQLENLSKDLHLETPAFNCEIPLIKLSQKLSQKVEELESQVSIRRQELEDLHLRQLSVCERLGHEPIKRLAESPLPLSSEVDELRANIERLENEAIIREKKFVQMRQEIIGTIKQLNIVPSTEHEIKIVNLTEAQITDHDMEELSLFNERLLNQLERVKEDIKDAQAKIDDLWIKLETDIDETELFKQSNIGKSLGETLHNLQEYLKYLEYQKKSRLPSLIMKQREKLADLWEKCHCTEVQKKSFRSYYSHNFSEELFNLHELEIVRWEKYYNENKRVFVLLEEHQKLCDEYMALELNSRGADRYKNRGGQLLAEEKRRNKLKKKISQAEENLRALTNENNEKEFRTFGLTVQEYLIKLHQNHEQKLKQTLSARKEQRKLLTPGKSPRCLFPQPGTSSRKITTKNKNKFSLPKLVVTKTKRHSRSLNQTRRRTLSFKSPEKIKNSESDSETTNYDEFEDNLSSKSGGCRSTGYVLKDQIQ